MTSFGLRASSTSGPRPIRSNVPGRKFSISTWASSHSESIAATPSGDLRSRVTHRLLRDAYFHHKVTPSRGSRHPMVRVPSPPPGRSTLTTSAPKSARYRAQPGAAITLAQSITRMSAGEGLGVVELRGLYGAVPDHVWTLAGRAVQIVEWDRTHQYCGRCGTATEAVVGERAKRCPTCGLLAFPRLAPAVIVLIERGDEVLLARNRNFPIAMYSALAGFVEPGETLEEAVHREVAEEVGVELSALGYFASQPWPFPHSLMIGFIAKWGA